MAAKPKLTLVPAARMTLPGPDVKFSRGTIGESTMTPLAPAALFDRVAPLVRFAAARLAGVQRAYVTEDGTDFLLIGEQQSWELGEHAAELSVAIQLSMAPSFEPHIVGHYQPACGQPLQGYRLVFPEE